MAANPAGSGTGSFRTLGEAAPSSGPDAGYRFVTGSAASTWLKQYQANNTAPIVTPIKQVQANVQKNQQQQNKSFFGRVGNDLSQVAGKGEKAAKSVGSTFIAPFKAVVNKATQQVNYFAHPQANKEDANAIMQNQAAAQKNPEYLKAIQSISSRGNSVNGLIEAQRMAAAGVKAPQIVQHLKQDAAAVDKNNKTALGVGTQLVSDVVGGGEAKGAIEAAKGIADVSKAAKVVKAVKNAVPVVAAGGAGGAGSTLQSNPNTSGKQIAVGAGEGAAVAGGLVGAGKALGAGFRMVFGKAPAEAPRTVIPVTDESTGTTTGKVTKSLPASTGVTAKTVPSTHLLAPGPRPSDAGYTDAEFRGQFNNAAKQVVKNTPEVQNAYLKTGSHDPLTLTMQTLADSKTKAKTGGIVDTMLPGLSKGDRSNLINSLVKNNDPHEAAHLIYDASSHHEAAQPGSSTLVGTPLDKRISFENPSDVENAQRNQLHVRVGQINKALANHENGTVPLNGARVAALQTSRQTAQDVLEGKTTHEAAYGPKPVQPLPFHGDVAAPSKLGGVLSDIPEVAKGDTTRQALINRRNAVEATNHTFHEAQAKAAFKKLAPGDIKVLEKLETKDQMDPKAEEARAQRIINANAKKPGALLDYYHIMRADLNTALEHRQALHPETGKLSNYFQHFFDRSDPTTNEKLVDMEQQKARIMNGEGKPGYTQHRTIDSYATADAAGLKRSNANVHEDYLQTIHQTAAENGRAALVKGLKEAHGEGSVSNYVGRDAITGQKFHQLHISGADNISMPKALAEHYNSRAPYEAKENPNLADKAYAGYKRVNKAAKNVLFAGGAFHGTQSALTIAGQQLIDGIRHPLNLADNLRLIGDTFSPKLRAAHMKAMENNTGDFKDGMSSVQRQKLGGLTYTDLASKATDGEKVGILNKLPGVKQLHSLVFDRQLPAAKQMIYDQKTAHLDLTNPADLAKARKIGAGINNMIGGIDHATQGLPPKVASHLSDFLLAEDYTEGRFKTIGDSIVKWGANRPEGRLARQAVVGKSVVTAIPGMIALVAAGKLNPHDLNAVGKAYIQQILSPQIPTGYRGAPTNSNAKGNPITLKLPTTYVAEIAKVLAPLIDPKDTFSNNRLSGIEEFGTARLAAAPNAAEKLATNKDFYGNPIITGNAKTSAANIAEQFGPIPVQSGLKTAAGKQNVAEAVLNEAGLRPSASTLPADTAHAQRLNEFYNTLYGINDKVRKPLIKQINTLIAAGQPNQARRLADEYNSSLNQRLMPFRSKYANNYNPAFDQNFISSLPIKTSGNAFKVRQQDMKTAQALLQ